MTPPARSGVGTLRMLFEISRDDNPRLYDDLLRFNKGPKRVNRLRFLAYEGLLAQPGLRGSSVSRQPFAPGRDVEVDASTAAHTIQAFKVPADP